MFQLLTQNGFGNVNLLTKMDRLHRKRLLVSLSILMTKAKNRKRSNDIIKDRFHWNPIRKNGI